MKLLLVAVNAKYIHTNPAVYSLQAYASAYKHEYKEAVEVVEYTINHKQEDILAQIYKEQPDVVGFSCYIWNFNVITSVIVELHKLMPNLPIWLGGPEVSFHGEKLMGEYPMVTGIMIGEGEETFAQLTGHYVEGKKPLSEIDGILYRLEDGNIGRTKDRDITDLSSIPFLYDSLEPFENRILYYESSRGCPFRCSYCLSSIEKTLRLRKLDLVKKELQFFLDHKVSQVKFIDRTFNCNHDHAMEIWSYILEHDNGVTNFHFEIATELMKEDEIELLGKMRPGLVQLEIGVQTTNEHTIEAIRRKMSVEKVGKVVAKIQEGNNIHLHLDLIAGLPFEGIESFAKSFNDVYGMKPEQLQLGFLKVLKGSYMEESAEEYGLVYLSKPPYEVLRTNWLSYEEILHLKRIEEMVELYYNSNQFRKTISYLEQEFETPFALYKALAEFYEQQGYFINQPSRMYRYHALLQFADSVSLTHHELYVEALTYDLYARENLKSRPAFSRELEPYKKEMREFYKQEEIQRKYLPSYKQYQGKQLAKMTHIEVFKTMTEGLAYVLFDYENRDPLTYEAKIMNITEEIGGVHRILDLLDSNYGTEYKCYLNYSTPEELLVATMLSAQCTDARVNIVTEKLFKKYTCVEDFANANLKELEQDIFQTGFYHNKAKNIIACNKELRDSYDCKVPRELEQLTALAGVGRKTANVVRGNIFNEPSVVVDTHVKRISKKLGITEEEDPVKIEFDLMNKLPKDHWILYNTQLIRLGREICVARSPKCQECFLKEVCPSYDK